MKNVDVGKEPGGGTFVKAHWWRRRSMTCIGCRVPVLFCQILMEASLINELAMKR